MAHPYPFSIFDFMDAIPEHYQAPALWRRARDGRVVGENLQANVFKVHEFIEIPQEHVAKVRETVGMPLHVEEQTNEFIVFQ